MSFEEDGDSIHHLPPSPIRSPAPKELNEIGVKDAESYKRREYLPSILSVLRMTHRYSSYAFSAFTIVHFLNTGVAPLLSPLDDLTFADENLTAARALYRSSYLSEAVLVFGSLGVHVVSGLAIRIIRIGREYIWYKHKARLPTLSWNSLTGYIIIPFVSGHFLVTRYFPWKLDIDVTSSFVGHWISSHPQIGWAFYSTFVSLSALHMTNGLGQWLGLTRKYRYRINSTVVGVWLLGLVKVVAHGIVGGFRGRQYDAVHEALMKQIQHIRQA